MSGVKHSTPWRVYCAPLRPQFPVKIIEIHDADGKAVIPWRGFDDIDVGSFTARLKLARRIVKAVNAAATSHGGGNG